MASSKLEASRPVGASTLRAFAPGYEPDLSRISSLDVLKGIAVMAGLLVSILYWGGFSQGMQQALTDFPGGVRYRTYAVISLLLEGKMMGLVSLSFGAGIILFFVRPHLGSGLSNSDLYVRRNMWLILFGLVNAFVFLWPMDFLFHLGVMGLLLFPFPRMKAKWLLVSVVLVLLISSGKYYWNFNDDTRAYSKFVVADSLSKKYQVRDSIQKRNDSIAGLAAKGKDSTLAGAKKSSFAGAKKKSADTLTRKQKKQIEEWEGIAKKYKWEKKNDSARIKALQEVSYFKNWETQIGPAKQREAQWFYTIGVWELASIMLLGMWLFKIGFFSGRFSSKQYLITAFAGISFGILCGWYRLHFLTLSIDDYTKYVQQHLLPHTLLKPLEIACMVGGYASLLMFVISRSWLQGLRSFFADAGRMALSHYLLQSMLLSIFFYGYGMGYYARILQPGLYLVVFEVWIVHVLFTVFWTKFYYMGPAEWLLKSLIHRKRVPIKRIAQTTDEKTLQTPTMVNHD
jgi:uncharacterized protein